MCIINPIIDGLIPRPLRYEIRQLNINGKGFSKTSKPTKRDGAYHLQFDFSLLFSADERLETGKFGKW